jgi:hypothetical protein
MARIRAKKQAIIFTPTNMESKDVRILFTALETHSLALQHACRHQPRQSVLVTVSPESDL